MDCTDDFTAWRNSSSTFQSSYSVPGSSIGGQSSRASTNTEYSFYAPSSCSTASPAQKELPNVPQRAPTSTPTFNRFYAHLGPAPPLYAFDPKTYYVPQPSLHPPQVPPHCDLRRIASSNLVRATNTSFTRQQKKEDNKFVCVHCGETFSKSSDRKKHFNNSCKGLGGGSPAWQCLTCNYIGRNEFQVVDHQKRSHADGNIAEISPPLQKPRFTCSTHDHIWRDPNLFIQHYSTAYCSPNRFTPGSDIGDHSRVQTLLCEGRDDSGCNHDYMYGALMKFCDDQGLPAGQWRKIVKLHTSEQARVLANRLEWGLVPADGSALSQLGFTSVEQMIRDVMTPLGSEGAYQKIARESQDAPQKPPPSSARPSSISTPSQDPGRGFSSTQMSAGQHSPTQEESARVSESLARLSRHFGEGESKLKPRALDEPLPIDIPVPSNSSRYLGSAPMPADPHQGMGPQTIPHIPVATQQSKEPRPKRPISEASKQHPEDLARVQAVRQKALPFRQTSKDMSEVKPSAVKSTPKSSPVCRLSDEVFNAFIDYEKYRSDDLGPNTAPVDVCADGVFLVQGSPVPAPAQYFSPKEAPIQEIDRQVERPKTPKDMVKAVVQKFTSAGIREIDRGPSPPRSARVNGKCNHCGRVGHVECLTGHIDDGLRGKRDGGWWAWTDEGFQRLL